MNTDVDKHKNALMDLFAALIPEEKREAAQIEVALAVGGLMRAIERKESEKRQALYLIMHEARLLIDSRHTASEAQKRLEIQCSRLQKLEKVEKT